MQDPSYKTTALSEFEPQWLKSFGITEEVLSNLYDLDSTNFGAIIKHIYDMCEDWGKTIDGKLVFDTALENTLCSKTATQLLELYRGEDSFLGKT